LTYNLTRQQRTACITRYRLPNEIAQLLQEVATLQNHTERLIAADMSNSELDRMLHPFGDSALAVVCCMEPAAAPAIRHYQHELRMLKPILNGHALQEMGVVAGPVLGQMLRQLRTARLDGCITSEAEERAWVVAQRDQQQGMGNDHKDTTK
jgi:tRNA nucleotidyltransferase (CCA-adding enzyme)